VLATFEALQLAQEVEVVMATVTLRSVKACTSSQPIG